jgi:hypothetical protein
MNLNGAMLLRDATDLAVAKASPEFRELIGGTNMEPLCYPCLLVRDCPHCKRVDFLYRGHLKEKATELNHFLLQMFGTPETLDGTTQVDHCQP